jgi:hypothetical protein
MFIYVILEYKVGLDYLGLSPHHEVKVVNI